MKTERREIVFAGIWLLFWFLFVLYPQPQNLGKSLYRLYENPANSEAEGISDFLEEIDLLSPQGIEEFVIENISYRHDWAVYNMPWYFPITEEVLEKRAGDCKSRMVVMASIFDYFGFSYDIVFSPSHIWIEYEGKKERRNENREVAMVSTGDEFTLKLPKIEVEESLELFVRAYIRYMPKGKKLLLLFGTAIFFSFVFWKRKTFQVVLKE